MSVLRFNHPWVDETAYPVFRVSFPDVVDDRAYADYLDQLDAWTRNSGGPYAWVIHPIVGSAMQRKMMADSQKKRTPFEKVHNTCYAFVVADTLARGAITAIFWLTPPPVAYRIFADKDSAVAWAKEMVRERQAERERFTPPRG